MRIQPVVLCGGSGTRLWPLSRERHPKQLLALNGRLSLLQETVGRMEGPGTQGAPPSAPVVLCRIDDIYGRTGTDRARGGAPAVAAVPLPERELPPKGRGGEA